YFAETDKKTVINMTNHSFFNLSGNPAHTILDHVLLVNADSYTPLNEELITTGTLENVASSPFDFTSPISVKDALSRDSLHEQLQRAQGFDHNYVLRTPRSEEHTSELQSRENLVCRLLLEKKKSKSTRVQASN